MPGLIDLRLSNPVVYGGLLVAISLWGIKKIVAARGRLPLPPGPKGVPLIGNVADLPPPGAIEWQHWISHKDLYGPISSVTVFNQTIILIHDLNIAFELLDKRSAKFSSRPYFPFAGDLCGYGVLMTFQRYNRNWRQQRKIAAGQLGSNKSIIKFQPTVDLQVRRFLLNTLRNPGDLVFNLQDEAASVMLDMIYGYQTGPTRHDPLVVLVNKMMQQFGDATVAGTWLVDLIPALKYVPNWMPGAGFQETARQSKQLFKDITDISFDFTEQQRAHGTQRPSYVSGHLDKGAVDRTLLKYSAIGLYGGGADTTVAALGFFYLAMMLYPEMQQKAWEEIDRVVGGDRLPGFDDRENLPYIEALVKETFRWVPTVPMGVPHTTDEEDEYGGYRIPKGSMVVTSIAWFARDPNVYHDPETFNPDRFLGPNPEPNPLSFIFGFGRRICPGRKLADVSIYLTIAQSLAVFEIRKPIDPISGNPIEPVFGMTPGLIAHPTEFKCNFAPRSEKHAELIKSIDIEHPWGEGDAKFLEKLSV
ncbi:Cytochrome P450 monooxygenase CLM2 [Drechslerella dactyloides]|uniref:Cytochrome P450 monooxygenase CLM2 n=1 Tax=Drechslerella dactyloides TaxID=74499 RepID=A0AAD6IV56_DREDA|nr:Cytochrome P450 monooxygenase CLM2 [Drechslerella dactyloides]